MDREGEMKIKLIHRQTRSAKGFVYTNLTHVKVVDDNGKFLAFAKITPELLNFISNIAIEAPDELLRWGKK
jgi:hypothetical protein